MTPLHQRVDTNKRIGERLVGIEQLEGRQLLASFAACTPETCDSSNCDTWKPTHTVLEVKIAGTADISSEIVSADAHVDTGATETGTHSVSSVENSLSSMEATGSVGHTQLTDAALAEAASPDNYRVWKANKRVFLYPESWATPEFRPDKSPIFSNLEDELIGQSENGNDFVELPDCRQLRVASEAFGYCDQGNYEWTLYCFVVKAGL